MAKVILDALHKNRQNWLHSFSKEVSKRFPCGDFGYSEEHKAWQIRDRHQRVLVSIGLRESEYIYLYIVNGLQVTGRTRDLKELKEIVPKVGY